MAQSDVGAIERALAVGDAIVFVYDPREQVFELRGSDIEILALGVDIGADVSTKRVPLDALLRRARADDARNLTRGIDVAVDRGDAFETVVGFGDGAATTWLAVRGRRDDGNGAGPVIGTMRDVSSYKRLEAEHLELVRATEAVTEPAGEFKDDLLARIGHEMRTPLNAVIGFGKLLASDDLGSEQRENAEQIVQAGETLLRLLNELLDASRPANKGEPASARAERAARPDAAPSRVEERRAPAGRVSRPAASATTSTERRAPASATIKTVLYVEDNPSNLRLVERILGGREEYTLLAATTGHDGLRVAREQRPDLVLLDLHLPDINGDAVLERLRSSPETRAIPVLMLSADATPAQVDRLLELGATDYMTKPLDIDEFLETLQRMCSTNGR